MISQSPHKGKTSKQVKVRSLATQSELIDCYIAYEIPDFYQKLVISHLKKIPESFLETYLQQQINSISQNSSHIQLFMKKHAQKVNIENFLRLILKAKPKQKEHKQNIEKICEHMGRLRKANYKMAYFMCKIKEKYDTKNKYSTQKHFYCQFAASLNNFTNEMIRSQITNYLEWQHQYDPFLLFIKPKVNEYSQEAKQALEKLLSFSIDESVNILKMHKVLQKWTCPEHSKNKNSSNQSHKMQLPALFQKNRMRKSLIAERTFVQDQSDSVPQQKTDHSRYSLIRPIVHQKAPQNIPTVSMHKTRHNRDSFVSQSKRQGHWTEQKSSERYQELQQHYQSLSNVMTENRLEESVVKQDSLAGKIKRKQRILTEPSRTPVDDKFTTRSIQTRNMATNTQLNIQRRLNILSPIRQKVSQLKSETEAIERQPRCYTPRIQRNLVSIEIIPFKIPTLQYNKEEATQTIELKNSKQQQEKPEEKEKYQNKPEEQPEKKEEKQPQQNNNREQLRQTADFQKQEASIQTFPQKQVRQIGINVSITEKPSSPEPIQNKPSVRTSYLLNKKYSEQSQKKVESKKTLPLEHTFSQKRHLDTKPDKIVSRPKQEDGNRQEVVQAVSKQPSVIQDERNQSRINIHMTPQKSIGSYDKKREDDKDSQSELSVPQPKVLKSQQSLTISKEEEKHEQVTNKKIRTVDNINNVVEEKYSRNPAGEPRREKQIKSNQISQEREGVKTSRTIKQHQQHQTTNIYESKPEQDNSLERQKPKQQVRQQIELQPIPPKKKQKQIKQEQPRYYPLERDESPPRENITNNQESLTIANSPKPSRKEEEPQSELPQPIRESRHTSNTAKSNILVKPSSESSNYHSPTEPPKPEPPKPAKKQIKMKVTRINFSEFRKHLKAFPFHPQYAQNFDVQKAIMETQYQQTYFCQFQINSSPGVIAVSSLTQNNNFVIRLWALSKNCQLKIAQPIFQKYLALVEKYVTNQQFYFRGPNLHEVLQGGFTSLKANIFSRKRKTKARQIESQFQQNLSIMCSQLAVVQAEKNSLFASSQIQAFDHHNAKINPKLFLMSIEALPEPLKNIVSIDKDLPNLKAANKKLKEEGFDLYTTTSKVELKNIDLCTLNVLSEFKELFVACDGHFKFFGNVVVKQQNKLICSIKLSKNNGRVTFAKGYKTCSQVAKALTNDTSQKLQFVVPMFQKLLYGEYKEKSSDKTLYASWDISLFWQDQMQGLIMHTMKGYEKFGSEKFYVSIELQGYLCYVFSVEQNDFLQ